MTADEFEVAWGEQQPAIHQELLRQNRISSREALVGTADFDSFQPEMQAMLVDHASQRMLVDQIEGVRQELRAKAVTSAPPTSVLSLSPNELARIVRAARAETPTSGATLLPAELEALIRASKHQPSTSRITSKSKANSDGSTTTEILKEAVS